MHRSPRPPRRHKPTTTEKPRQVRPNLVNTRITSLVTNPTSAHEAKWCPRGPGFRLARVGSDELHVKLGQLGVTASQWQDLRAQLAAGATPPAPGQPFQATAAAVSGIGAAIGGTGVALATRTQATAAAVAAAAAGYANQEATAAGEMAAVTQVRVV
ncbi:hypothetical protein SHTP_0105 [Mycobacterium ulcerans subsp. shinshuense]|uniref:Uncharacterized protein n=1 Tax=Mycobacterium ulcerans subsp. shinshuense TaxID=1124626 RepID=A0A1B4XXH3_MYCUL|nr:hypothetical protein SHTP_0105 [Mycobacterium ulcerans subsp. shinshuense]